MEVVLRGVAGQLFLCRAASGMRRERRNFYGMTNNIIFVADMRYEC